MKNGYLMAFSVGLSMVAIPASAAVPGVGDLSFVAINASEDGFALASFVDLIAGTQLFVTDKSWNGLTVGAGGAFDSGEGVLSWTLSSALSAGSVVRFSAVDSAANVAVSHGTVSRSGSFSLAQTNESVMLYRDDGVGGVLPLAALGYGTSFASEIAGSGLEAKAIALGGTVKFAEYTGDRSSAGGFGGYAESVGDPSQWAKLSSGDVSLMAPNLTAFTVMAPVPEPETYAMLLAGLGVVSAVARRRKHVG
ncbi:PEP-CTERM sorting domain-containing protein [Denitromonas ohlonensis]|uniref:PEP-CTERM sorting domain-containing protein n=3 Tax=Denitromonas TaxID=139331 RepID=A0A557RSH1_9RHOO|nr:PEP-CTERM sorting domain-containing protein [Denitromonas ohlonensis]TVO68118.1 PEP-CTERM sorting domain-containing protein [Denitromonas ohlonensis]TVO77977.1 PEP-CTERM sorting domain-containing protein [Denitromonas ohlonensis]